MSLLDHITIEQGKCGGRPCIRGMHIRVKDVLEMLAARVPEKGNPRRLPLSGAGAH
jgi:uncharacterized protein (DUF433 family)